MNLERDRVQRQVASETGRCKDDRDIRKVHSCMAYISIAERIGFHCESVVSNKHIIFTHVWENASIFPRPRNRILFSSGCAVRTLLSALFARSLRMLTCAFHYIVRRQNNNGLPSCGKFLFECI